MLNKKQNPVEWAVWMTMLSEAHEHLGDLIKELEGADEDFDIDFGVQLGHVYGHLNRAWNGRRNTKEIDDDTWEQYTKFPEDIILNFL